MSLNETIEGKEASTTKGIYLVAVSANSLFLGWLLNPYPSLYYLLLLLVAASVGLGQAIGCTPKERRQAFICLLGIYFAAFSAFSNFYEMPLQ